MSIRDARVGTGSSAVPGEDAMPTKKQGQIVKTPTEARQGVRGPSILALLVISTGLAIIVLGVVWLIFIKG